MGHPPSPGEVRLSYSPVDMLVALITVHMKDGFFVPSGIEFPLTLLAALICLAISGGGSFSRKGW